MKKNNRKPKKLELKKTSLVRLDQLNQVAGGRPPYSKWTACNSECTYCV
jgi:hypothetical protein